MTTHTEEQVHAKLAQLGLVLDPNINYRYETLFAKIDGWGAAAYLRRKHKLHRNVEPFLGRVLRDGEEVLIIGKGVYQGALEQYLMGALLAQLVNQTVFILTNLRLIMVHSDTKGVPGHTYWTVFYNQIDTFKSTWLGMIHLKLRDGKKLSFAGFEKLDRTRMPAIFQQAIADYRELGFDPAVSQSRENMCGHCLALVPAGEYVCPKCGTTFWTPTELALRSLAFPSWGDFLMRHRSAAWCELVGYLISWFVIVMVLLDGVRQGGGGVAPTVTGVVVLLAIGHAVDAFVTYYIGRKGLYIKKAPT
ncbi:MAG: hypothetical protein FJ297_06810 [Planctomycetes bacterium]|nr:hypothetical protein [Planctomycetota bacterium]